MEVTGFHLEDYRALVDSIYNSTHQTVTVSEAFDSPSSPFVVLRHDVDRNVQRAIDMAHIEHEVGVESTFYFRNRTWNPETVTEIASMGHEIGYHYETLGDNKGEMAAAIEQFENELNSYRRVVNIDTICPHGRPLSPHRSQDILPEIELSEYDIKGDAYDLLDKYDLIYASDTNRSWNTHSESFGPINTTSDLKRFFEASTGENVYILAHPGRWARTRKEMYYRAVWDGAANSVKWVVKDIYRRF
jgi:hypothetical protein